MNGSQCSFLSIALMCRYFAVYPIVCVPVSFECVSRLELKFAREIREYNDNTGVIVILETSDRLREPWLAESHEEAGEFDGCHRMWKWLDMDTELIWSRVGLYLSSWRWSHRLRADDTYWYDIIAYIRVTYIHTIYIRVYDSIYIYTRYTYSIAISTGDEVAIPGLVLVRTCPVAIPTIRIIKWKSGWPT